MIKLTSILNEESPCWKGYRQIGMKTKNGKEVPNCVPINDSVNEANAVSGGKVHKFITGKNLTLKGKKYSDIEFEVKGIDNSNQLVNLKVLFPKNIFGQEIKVPFKTIRRGPFIKTDTSKINEASIDKASQTYFKLVDVVKGLEDNQKTLFGAYKQAQKRGDNEYMVKALDSMKGNQQKLNKARKELERAEKEYFSSVSSTHRSLELDYED